LWSEYDILILRSAFDGITKEDEEDFEMWDHYIEWNAHGETLRDKEIGKRYKISPYYTFRRYILIWKFQQFFL
jgi:hypothetical protein